MVVHVRISMGSSVQSRQMVVHVRISTGNSVQVCEQVSSSLAKKNETTLCSARSHH